MSDINNIVVAIYQNYICPACNSIMNGKLSEDKPDIIIISCEASLHCSQRYKVYEVEMDYIDATYIKDNSEPI